MATGKAAVFFGVGKPFEIRDVTLPDVEPEDFSLQRARPEEVPGGTPAENADTTRRIFSGLLVRMIALSPKGIFCTSIGRARGALTVWLVASRPSMAIRARARCG